MIYRSIKLYCLINSSNYYNTINMSFSAVPAMVGVPDFGLIKIDEAETAKAFQEYLDTASKLTGVSLDDINCSVISEPADVSRVTLSDLVASGMKLFDAVVWLSAGRPKTHPLTVDGGMKKESIPSLHEIARAVFYCYFMILTQARYPVLETEKVKPKIPNFLRTVMGMTEEQHVYVNRICSFAPQKFGAGWARHVKFAKFGQEVISRFGLGVAGYRMFGPFKLYAPKPDMPESLKPAFQFARNVATADPSWDIHPLTRNPHVLSSRGNLNKNLGNLILECFSDGDIEEMEKAKIIYKKPEREPAHRNYTQWTANDDITGTAKIFY